MEPQFYYLCILGAGGLCNSFPMQRLLVQALWESGLSVSFFIGLQPQVSNQREILETGEEMSGLVSPLKSCEC